MNDIKSMKLISLVYNTDSLSSRYFFLIIVANNAFGVCVCVYNYTHMVANR